MPRSDAGWHPNAVIARSGQPNARRQRLLRCLDAGGVVRSVLRKGARPAGDELGERLQLEAEVCANFVQGGGEQLLVGQVQRGEPAAAAVPAALQM